MPQVMHKQFILHLFSINSQTPTTLPCANLPSTDSNPPPMLWPIFTRPSKLSRLATNSSLQSTHVTHLLARPPSAVTPPRRLFPIQSCLLCRPKNGTSCLAPASACAQSACTQQTLARPNSPWLFSCQFQLHQRPSQCSCHFSSFLLQTREAGYLPHACFFFPSAST